MVCRRCASLPLLCFAAFASLAAPATARAGDRAAADALFEEAKKLTEEGNFEAACPKFAASYHLDETLGTLLNLANCHEKIGKVATAWAEWGEGAARAARQGDDRASYAEERREALAGRLPRLTIQVTRPRPGLEVRRDDVLVEPATFGVALPVDPGDHVVVVKRDGAVLKEARVTAVEGQQADVALDLAAIEAAAPKPRPAPAPSAPDTKAAPERPPAHPRKTAGFVVGGVGLAALGVAGVFEIVALTSKPAEGTCGETFCTPKGISAANKAKTFATVGQWLGVGGLVAIAAGVTLVLTAPDRGDGARPASARVAPWIGPQGAGLAVEGAL